MLSIHVFNMYIILIRVLVILIPCAIINYNNKLLNMISFSLILRHLHSYVCSPTTFD